MHSGKLILLVQKAIKMYFEEEEQTFKCVPRKYADVFISNDMTRLSALAIITLPLQKVILYTRPVHNVYNV